MASQSISKTKPLRIALIGGETLLGREIRDVLETRLSGSVITAYAANAEGGFADQEGEAVYIQPFTGDAVTAQDAVILAGTEEGAQKAYASASASGAFIIDCSGYLEGFTPARLSAPLLQVPALDGTRLVALAHPAAAALSLVLTKLARKFAIESSIAHIFEPASERGKRGLNELHQQTASLLSFKPLDKHVFDAQVSFNLLSKYGEEAPLQLVSIEDQIARQTAVLIRRNSKAAALPSIRVIQAPVFHGYSMSLWIQFAQETAPVAIADALASVQIDVRTGDQEAPTNVESAGQSGLVAGDIRADRNNSRAVWLWITGDNLRLTADACADVLTEWKSAQA